MFETIGPRGAGGDGCRLLRVLFDPDFDLNSTFDVPAFLRRQEG